MLLTLWPASHGATARMSGAAQPAACHVHSHDSWHAAGPCRQGAAGRCSKSFSFTEGQAAAGETFLSHEAISKVLSNLPGWPQACASVLARWHSGCTKQKQ